MKNISANSLGVLAITVMTAMTPLNASAVDVYACRDVNVSNVSSPTGNCTKENWTVTQIPIEKPNFQGLLQHYQAGEMEFRRLMSNRIGTSKTNYQGIADKLETIEKSKPGNLMPTTILIKNSGWHNDGANATAPTCSNTGKYHITYKVWFSGRATSDDKKTKHIYGSDAKNGKCITVDG